MPPSRLPRFRRAASISPIELTERDREILQLVHRHRFARSSDISMAVGGSPQGVLRRLQLLYHHGYLERPRAQIDYYHRGGSREIVYGLGNKGAPAIGAALSKWGEKNRSLGRPQLEHWVMVAEITLAIESAARARAIRFLSSQEIDPRNSPHSFRWSVQTAQGETLGIFPDRVFGLDLSAGDFPQRVVFCLEADRGTMPVVRPNLAQSSIRKKLLAYAAAWHEGLHTERLHCPRFRVLIVTASKERAASILAACSQLERGRGLFLVTDRDSFSAASNPFTLEWRTGKPGETTRLLS